MRSVLKIIMAVLLTLAAVLALIIIYAHLTFYDPAESELLHNEEVTPTLTDTSTISVMTWNLGYAGLDKEMDFFYDGGTQVRTTRDQTIINLNAILDQIKHHKNLDFFLLQEADKAARRSYFINMPDSIKSTLPEAHLSFAKNYHVRFVPVPWYAPMGRVTSGIVTAGHHSPEAVYRLSFPGNYPWPGRLFNLKRGLLLSRYPLTNGKELILINTHNSAFDDGSLRRHQMDFLKKIMHAEYAKGNYVIAGGDFNQCPPGFEPEFFFNLFDDENVLLIPDDFMPDWHFVYDPTVPTNRSVIKPYSPATTKTTLIDFFIASPNVMPLGVQGIHLDFEHSDHNPVIATFKLLGPHSMPPDRYISR